MTSKKSDDFLKETLARCLYIVILFALGYALVKDFKESSFNNWANIILLVIVVILAVLILIRVILFSREGIAICILKDYVLKDECTDVKLKTKKPKLLNAYKENFKTDFNNFYTAEVKMDKCEVIHLQIKGYDYDGKEHVESTTIMAHNFLRYFEPC